MPRSFYTKIRKKGVCLRFQITLPTGTKIEVLLGVVTIFASMADQGQVNGLCGTYNGRCEDDFQLRDGSYNPAPPYSCTNTRESFPEFADSWRLVMQGSFNKGFLNK